MGLRTWTADKLDDFAYWLESGAARKISGLAWRISPRVQMKMTGPINEIVAATILNRSNKLAETITKNNALLKALAERK